MTARVDAASATTVRASARAVVCAGGVETEYVRAGRGEPLVAVLGDLDSVDAQQMIAVLARDYLVFAASPPGAAADLTSWLRQFLEGLGVTDAHVLLHSGIVANLQESE